VILAFVLPLALYVYSLAPTYIPIDSAEFTMCMYYFGVCHPPGFPLYTFLGHIFINTIPFGDAAYRANLFSAFFGALTVLFVYLTLLRLKVEKVIAFLLALIFAVNAVFWEFSIAADVFSFGTFILTLFFYLALGKRYYLSVFVLGLSASHFYITGVLAPILYWYFWGFDFGRNSLSHAKRVLFSSLVFFAGFFPQGVMYWRMQTDLPINWGHAKGLGGFWYFLRRQEFGSIFLISNPVLTFSPVKVFNQAGGFLSSLFTSFAGILVLVVPVGIFLKSARVRNLAFLALCFAAISGIQLVLLGTLGAPSEENPFQLNKFYLNAFLIFVLSLGITLSAIAKKFFSENSAQLYMLLGLVLFILFVSHIKPLNYSRNNFSRNYVLDAMEQVEGGSLAITVSHIMYFGARYEVEVGGKFEGVTLMYFPNEKNRDSEQYNPAVLAGGRNMEFIEKVRRGKTLGAAEEYVLDIISRNMDRDIYILQGTFEEGFFAFLRLYLRPHGLWWKLEGDIGKREDIGKIIGLYEGWRNGGIKYDDLHLKQQRHDVLGYAVSYNSMAVYLASLGNYSQALNFFHKSLDIRRTEGAANSIGVIERIVDLEGRYKQLIENRDLILLEDLGDRLLTIGNFERGVEVYSDMISIKREAKYYTNLALCQANLGRTGEARDNYRKALEVDPDFGPAKQGMAEL